ncbi:MipA/OmpV family protein [Neorhizobium galegae]|uniref:MipA/OmpV family protein n=2 Tax=Neorhizobium galegae TaxID=399 RepID=UPI000621F433|nr:MipA/OmpV family protein [Neorhizobium galegae]MCQ1569969.1 MipA/OmpV family protein [Neorhizobium galegae]MCQ1807507.1 MipA/OmpV family protein [Neorhizobium galegae]CDZ56984.1 MltA-interacting MipA family protein [Neorhizobium galegae bv. orientalis]
MLSSKITPHRPSPVALLAMAFVAATSIAVETRAADLDEHDAVAAPPTEGFDNGRFGGIRQKLHDWNVVVGAGVMYAPKFEGSDEFEVRPIPVISARIGDRVSIDPTGLAVDLLRSNGFTLSVKGGYEMGRSEDDSDHLRGLGDVDAGGVIGGKLSYEFGPAELYASIDKTIGGSDGLTGKIGANVSQRYDRFILSAGASATIADDNHMESYFGVTSEQSARSGLSEYEAGAGLKRFDIEASVTYMATENWLIRGQAEVGFLTGDAADSPIVEDDVQPSAMLMIGYKF